MKLRSAEEFAVHLAKSLTVDEIRSHEQALLEEFKGLLISRYEDLKRRCGDIDSARFAEFEVIMLLLENFMEERKK